MKTNRPIYWAITGLISFFISAAIAKYNSGYPIGGVIEPVSVFIIMVGSILYLSRLGGHGSNRTALQPATK
jgi:hypothetical protein